MAQFVTISDWMLELGLNTSQLLAFAVVYSYGRNGGWFQGSSSHLAKWIGTKRKATVLDALASLVEKGLIEKREKWDNGKKICDYRPVRLPVRFEYRTGTETVPHIYKDSDSDKKEINNKERVHLTVDEFRRMHR